MAGARCPPYTKGDGLAREQDTEVAISKVWKTSSIKKSADVSALVAFMHAELRPLVEYTAFALPGNWFSVFRETYAKALGFPLNVFWPDRIRRTALTSLEAVHPYMLFLNT